eukprot:1182190-Prorocentrum_minimum.AAC.2
MGGAHVDFLALAKANVQHSRPGGRVHVAHEPSDLRLEGRDALPQQRQLRARVPGARSGSSFVAGRTELFCDVTSRREEGRYPRGNLFSNVFRASFGGLRFGTCAGRRVAIRRKTQKVVARYFSYDGIFRISCFV